MIERLKKNHECKTFKVRRGTDLTYPYPTYHPLFPNLVYSTWNMERFGCKESAEIDTSYMALVLLKASAGNIFKLSL
jgi:hypothetical protein